MAQLRPDAGRLRRDGAARTAPNRGRAGRPETSACEQPCKAAIPSPSAARNRGLKFLHMACLADNKRMQQLARKYDAELSFDFSSVVGEVAAPRPTPLSLMREIIADGHGFATTVFDVQSRLLKPV